MDYTAPSAPVTYYDRSTGLSIFGVLTIGLGCLCALLTAVTLLSVAFVASRPELAQQGVTVASIIPAVAIYIGFAVALVWMGIGSILARRWARALLLIFSWSWLLMGVMMVSVMAVLLPVTMNHLPATATGAGRPPLPPGALSAIVFFQLLVMSVLFVALPAVWTWFYSSRHVKATCEARNPNPSWTDACPVPLLAVCLWMFFGAVTMLITPFTGHFAVPFFGTFIKGLPGVIVYLVLAGVWMVSAGLLYRRDRRGWWLLMAGLICGTTSTVATFARHDMIDMYRAMNFPQVQIDQIQQMGMFEGNWIMWYSLLGSLPFYGYLIYVRRYLNP